MNVLVVAVHPDDETLGCGGTLLAHAASGDDIHWLLLTAAHDPPYGPDAIRQQREQVEDVHAAYPFASRTWPRFPTTRLDTLPLDDLVSAIRDVVRDVRPEVVYVPNRSDAHSDHRVAFQACAAVLKSFYLRQLGVKRVLMCETPSETDAAVPLPESVFVPQVFVETSHTMERKLEILSLYRSEVQERFLPRSLSSVKAWDRARGSTIGVEYAEAFMLLWDLR